MEDKFSRNDWVRQSQFHPISQTETLELVISRARDSLTRGHISFVVIDLDSTLYDVRQRTRQIIQSWLHVAQDLPHEIQEKLRGATLSSIGYSLKDTFQALELDLKNLDIEQTWSKLKDYWWDHFFSNDHIHHDEVHGGAVEYAHKLLEAGATVVYLTGRETSKMGAGTESKLIQDGFPLDGSRARLMMKQDPNADDALHKVEALRTLSPKGRIIASFENEPKNLMALVEIAPATMHVFVETACSDHPAKPGQGLYRIKDFTMES